jgi:hypothetical protein
MWMGSNRAWLIGMVSLLLLTAITTAQTLGGNKPKLGREIDVRCLYPAGTHCDYGVLFPLVLEYHNKSLVPQEFELRWSLQLDIPREYKTLVLEPGAKKRIPFLLPPGAINQLYSLWVNDQNVPVGVTSNSQNRVAGLLTSDNDNLDYIRSMQLVKNPYYNPSNSDDGAEYNTPQSLSNLDEEVFPDHWAALEALNILVCYDLTALNLGDNQYQAIVNWVRQGGELVVVSNGLPTEYRGTPLEEILPLTPESIVTDQDRVRVQGILKSGANTLVGNPGEEIFVEKSVLNGRVFYLTVPLLGADMLGKDETEMLWRHVFDKQPNYTNSPHSFMMMDSMPELPRTKAGWVALFVILYGIIVGPVNLSILRKKDKMLWSFVTVPVVAILFAGSAYVVNRFIRPSTPVLRELGYVAMQVEQKVGFAEAEQLLFSPHSQTFTISGDAGTFFEITGSGYGAFGNTRQDFGLYTQSPEGGLQSQLEMGTWDIQRFQARCNLELESSFVINPISNKKIEIESPLRSDLEGATVYIPSQGASDSFTLEPGTNTYDLTFTQSGPAGAFQWDKVQYPGRKSLLRQLHSTRAATTGKLYFWTQELETPLQIDQGTLDRHDYLVCVEFSLD